ncbi:MAG TPA: hypothetical protein VMG74_06730, partial [Gaiellaceae bacterium]|nr:hypothetical protein [Gaiellaceae bacterium]
MANLIDELDRHTGLGRLLSTLLVIVALFLLAWVVSRIATRIAAAFVDRSERRRNAGTKADSSVISSLRQRETAISLIETT